MVSIGNISKRNFDNRGFQVLIQALIPSEIVNVKNNIIFGASNSHCRNESGQYGQWLRLVFRLLVVTYVNDVPW